MKKKLLFTLINMNIGGTEKALLNLLGEISKEKYDISILMLEKYGGFLDLVPDHVNVKYIYEYSKIKDLLNKPPKTNIINLFKKRKIVKAGIMGLLYFVAKIMRNRSLLFKYLIRNFPNYNDKYDIAVAYDGPMDFISYFVLKRIKAKRKIQWIHFDVTKIGFNKHFAKSIYINYDKIFVVSTEAKNKLIQLVPSLERKTDVFSNVVSPGIIRSQAKNGFGFMDELSGIRILTVGRLSFEKGQDLAIKVLSRLLNAGYKVRWYFIGEGPAKEEYIKLAKSYNLNDNIIFLGAISNPYPFIEQCDLYVQPSRHEGYCIALAEAKSLVKPIVTTNSAGAREQIIDEETGLIVNPNVSEIYNALIKLINNSDLCIRFRKNLEKDTLGPVREIEKLYSLF